MYLLRVTFIISRMKFFFTCSMYGTITTAGKKQNMTEQITPVLDDRRLILLVEINDLLYDVANKNFKNSVLKMGIWNEIGRRLGCNGETAQRRWKNIKDAFLFSQRRMYSRPHKRGKRYKFADMLAFLKPHLTPKNQEISDALQLHEDRENIENTDQNLIESITEVDNSDQDMTLLLQDAKSAPSFETTTIVFPSFEQPELISRKRKRENTEEDKSRLKTPHHEDSVLPKQTDDIDYFFSAMACMVKSLPEKKRAEIKFKVHQLIHKAEMEFLEA